MHTNDKTQNIVEDIIKLTRSSDFNAEKIAEVRRLLRTIPSDHPEKQKITQWIEEAIWLSEGLV